MSAARAATVSAATRGLPPERSLQLACPLADLAQQHAHLLEPGSQLSVAHLDRQHRVLQTGAASVGPRDRLHGAVDEPPGVVCAALRRGSPWRWANSAWTRLARP